MGIAIPLIGAAISAAGTGVSIANAKATQRRMNDVVHNQIAATEGFQRQATPEFLKSLGSTGSEAANQQLSLGEQVALHGYQNVAALPVAAPVPALQDAIVNARTQARVAQSQQSQAALQGYNNLSLQQVLSNQRAQQNLGVISGLANSRSEITPFLLQGAQQQGQDLAAVGSLLGTAGSLAGVYGSLYPYLQQPGQPGQPPANRAGPGNE